MNALIVDNDKIIRLMMNRLLRKKITDDITEADNGLEALKLFQKKKPDFILLDISMPIVDGLEMLESLRSDQNFADIPVIIMSSNDDKRTILSLLKLGISDYILKPIELTKAYEKIASLVDKIKSDNVSYSIFNFTDPSKEKILVVHSNRDFLLNFNDYFSERFNVLFSDNGNTGMKLFIDHKPQTILLGENLALLSEAQFSKKIKEIDFSKQTKVFLLSDEFDTSIAPQDNYNGIIKYSPDLSVFAKDFYSLLMTGENLFRMLQNFFKSHMKKKLSQTAENAIMTFIKSPIKNIKTNIEEADIEFLASLDFLDKSKTVIVSFGIYGILKDILKFVEYNLKQVSQLNSLSNDTIKSFLLEFSNTIIPIIEKNNAVELEYFNFKIKTKSDNISTKHFLLSLPFVTETNEKFTIYFDLSQYIDK